MRPKQIKLLLGKLLPSGENVLLDGPPGVGKSALVEQACKEMKADFVAMHPVISDPTDFKGMPWAGERNGDLVCEFLPIGDLNRILKAKKRLVVHIEDIGQSVPAVQASIMQLIWGRRLNGRQIPDCVSFVATTNRRQDQAGVLGMITPLLDRFTTVVTVTFHMVDWCNWAIETGLPFELVTYGRQNPDDFTKFAPSRDMKKSPTPRSIAGLGRLFNAGITGATEEEREIFNGAVGEAFATKFLSWLRVYKEIPDVAEIYLNPDTTKVPQKPDILFALMGALANGASPDTMEATLTYLARMPKPEWAGLCMRDAIKRNSKAAKCAPFTRWVTKNAALFNAEDA